MLPPENRLRRSADFRRALKVGRGKSARTIAVRVAPAGRDGSQVRIGFIVSRTVGGAVVRNRVRRRLRHAARAQLRVLEPYGAYDVVVRALPPAAEADFAELARDLAACLDAVRPVAA